MKKLLALVLALVMTMSLVTISNAAFSDADKIDHKEAVEVMNALGVINGMPDGSFAPAGNVTRAEMAKMITIIMLGDIDAAAFKGTATDLTDINGHWAEGYIKYCYSQGVIAGKGNGTFAPDENVTAVQAAKMLLVAIGYNATVQGYVGSDWAINIIRDAQLSKFFDDLSVTSTKVLTRDEAAQMIWNAVQAPVIEKRNSVDLATGNITVGYYPSQPSGGIPAKTLLSEIFGAKKEYAYLTGITYDTTKKLYSYTFNVNGTTFGVAGTPDISTDADVLAGAIVTSGVTSAEDFSDLFGHKVAVVYKDKSTVYGIYDAAAVVVEGTFGELTGLGGANGTATKFKVAGTEYSVDVDLNNTKVVAFNNTTGLDTDGNGVGDVEALALDDLTSTAGTTEVNRWTKFVAIDNDDDGKINMIVAKPVAVGKVTFSGTTSFTVNGTYGQSFTLKDGEWSGADTLKYTVATKPAKGDYVMIDYHPVTNVPGEITILETATYKVTGLKTGDMSLQADGNWYAYTDTFINGDLNNTYKFQVVNGYLTNRDKQDGASTDLLYVIDGDNATALGAAKTKVMMADGTTEVVDVTKVGGTKLTNGQGVTGGQIVKDALYTYKISSGNYEITKVSSANLAGQSSYIGAGTLTNYNAAETGHAADLSDATSAAARGTSVFYAIADDAQIFLRTGATASDYKYSVITGKALKEYSDKTTLTITALLGLTNGQNTVKVATIATGATFVTNTTYAYITSVPTTTSENSTVYYTYTAQTADGAIEVKDNPVSGTPGRGKIVSLETQADGTVRSSDVTLSATKVNNALKVTPVAVTGYSETDKTITLHTKAGALYANAAELGKDVEYIYADTKNQTGTDGGEISLAERDATGKYTINALAISTTADGILALIVDTANKVDASNGLADLNTNNSEVGLIAGGTITAPASLTVTTYGGTVKLTVDGVELAANGTYQAVEGSQIVATVTGPALDANAVLGTAGKVAYLQLMNTAALLDKAVAEVATDARFSKADDSYTAIDGTASTTPTDKTGTPDGVNETLVFANSNSQLTYIDGGKFVFTYKVAAGDLAGGLTPTVVWTAGQAS